MRGTAPALLLWLRQLLGGRRRRRLEDGRQEVHRQVGELAAQGLRQSLELLIQLCGGRGGVSGAAGAARALHGRHMCARFGASALQPHQCAVPISPPCCRCVRAPGAGARPRPAWLPARGLCLRCLPRYDRHHVSPETVALSRNAQGRQGGNPEEVQRQWSGGQGASDGNRWQWLCLVVLRSHKCRPWSWLLAKCRAMLGPHERANWDPSGALGIATTLAATLQCSRRALGATAAGRRPWARR